MTQPGPGRDVACPVDIGVYRPAGRADHRVLPGPGASGPAGVAVDRGVGGVHDDDSPSGAFSLGGEDGRELAPAGIEDCPVSPAFCATLRPGASMVPLAEAVMLATRRSSRSACRRRRGRARSCGGSRAGGCGPTPLLGRYPPQSLAVPGAGLGGSLQPLQVGECRLGRVEGPGVGDHFGVRGREADHTHVDADRPACRRQRLGLGLHHDNDDVPPAVAASTGASSPRPTTCRCCFTFRHASA